MATIRGYRSTDFRSTTWTMTAPRNARSVTFPTLPTTPYDYNISASDQPGVTTVILFKLPGGYDAARAVLLSSESPGDVVPTATGSITFEAAANNLFLTGSSPSSTRTWPAHGQL